MGFLSNRSVTYLNLHNGFVEILNQIMMIYGSLFLYQHGFSIAAVFLMLGCICFGRIITRFLSFPLMHRIGLQKTVALGLTGFGTALTMLSQVKGLDGWFAAYVIIFILFNPIYWVCFHIYYTLMGEEKN